MSTAAARPKPLNRQLSWFSSAAGFINTDHAAAAGLRPGLIIGLFYFNRPLKLQDLRYAIRERLLPLPRFSQRVVDDGKGLSLVDVEVDLTHHVCEVEQTSAWSDTQFNEWVASRHHPVHALDVERPLWQVRLVPRLEDGRCVLVFLVDHCIGDGTALVAALLSLLDGGGTLGAPPPRRLAPPEVGPWARLWQCVSGVFKGLHDPLLPADPPNPLKQRDYMAPEGDKVVAQSDAVPLELIKRIKGHFEHATVNDIIFVLLTMTVRKYLDANHPGTKACSSSNSMRCMFMINQRSEAEAPTERMGNQFGWGRFYFPLDYTSPTQLVRTVQRRADLVKVSPQPIVERALQSCVVPLLMRLGLRKLIRTLVLHSVGKATMVISNVPGPQQQRTLCGETLSSMQYFLFSPVGAYIGVCSYAGSVAAGASLERALEPEPSKLMMHWKPSAYELLEACERERAGAQRAGA